MLAMENDTRDSLAEQIGREFGPCPSVLVGQERIDTFANATDDHQWIHTDPKRAGQSPFGGTIAHGFLTLSLLASAVQDAGVIPADAKAVLNYGLDKVRFLAPVPSGASVSARFTLVGVEPKGPGRKLIRLKASLGVDGADQPAVIAELLALVVEAEAK